MSKTLLVSGFSFLVLGSLCAQDARQIASESQKRGQSKSQQYEGTIEVIGSSKKISLKRWIFERFGSFGDSKAILRFTAPAEVKGVALLIVNHPDRASDQWMWTPALGPRSPHRAAGPIHSFLWNRFQFRRSGRARCGPVRLQTRGRGNFRRPALLEDRVEAQRKQIVAIHFFRVAIRKDNYVVIQIDNFSKEKLVRRIHYTDVQQQDGIWAGRTMEVQDLNRGSRTVMKLEKLQYNIPMKEESFTLEALRRG